MNKFGNRVIIQKIKIEVSPNTTIKIYINHNTKMNKLFDLT